MSNRVTSLALSAILFSGVCVATSFAQKTWDGGFGTVNWGDANNWNTNGVPSNTTAVIFDNDLDAGFFNIELGANRTTTGVTFAVGTDTNAFTFNNFTLTVNTGGIVNNDDLTQTFNSTVTVGGNQTWNAASGGLTFNNVNLNATLTLSGSNAIAINGTMTTAATRTLTNNNSGSVTIGSFALGGTLTVGGTGATSITGALTMAANRQITRSGAGNLTIGSVSATGNRRLTIAGTGTGTTTITGVAALNGGGITMNNANSTTTLSGANTYTGVTTITAGTLVAANNSALGTTAAGTTIASGATLALQGGVNVGTEALTSVTGTGVGSNGAIRNISGDNTVGGTVTYVGATTIGSTAGTLTMSGLQTATNQNLVYTGAGNITVSGNIQTGTGTLTKSGNGTLTLSGTNNYSGATAVNAGTLVAASSTALGAVGGGVTVLSGATLGFSGGVTIGAEALSVTGTGFGGGGALRNFSGTNGFGGAVTLAGDTTVASDAGTLTLSAAISGTDRNLIFNGAGNTTVSGAIGTSAGSVTMSGSGTLTLSGANTYTGGTTISSGTLMLAGANDRIDNASAVSVAGGANFDLNGFSDTVATISGAGNILLGGGTLTSGNATSTTFSGVISESGGITKQGTGTLTLSGANSYTGTTTISASGGVINIQNNTALGTSAGGTVVNSGGALEVQNNITVTDEALTLTGTGTGAATGALRQVSGTNLLDGNITLGGNTTIASAAGTLNVGQHVSPVSHETNTVDLGTSALTINTATGSTIDFRSRLTGTTATLTKDGAGNLVLSALDNTYTGLTTINDGTLTLATRGYAMGNKGILGNVVIGDNTGLAGSALLIYDAAVAGGDRIADGVNIRINEDGLLNLNGKSDTIGSLTFQGGDVQTGAGTLKVAGNLTFLSSGREANISGFLALESAVRTFDVAASTSARIDATINAGGINKTGDGTLILTSNDASTYAGTTTVNGGVLNVRAANALGQGNASDPAAGTEVNTGALQIQGGINIAAERLLLGSTGVSNDGGLLSISGNNTWGGSIVLDAASRINTNADTLTLSGATLDMASSALTFGGEGNTSVSKVISSSSAGTLTKDGNGTLFLSGNNTYSGNTLITQGVVNISNDFALGGGSGTTTITSGAALQVQGGITSGEVISLSGSGLSSTGAIRNLSGSNTLAGGISLSGTTRINSDSGTLTLSGAITGTGQALQIGGEGNTTLSGAINTGAGGTLTKDGNGTLTLSGTSNYTGTTTVNDGTLAFGSANVLGTSNLVATASGSIVDLNGFNQSIGSISGSGTIDFGGATLTLNGSSTFAGAFTDSGTLILGSGASLTFGVGFYNPNLNIVLNGGSLFLNDTYSTFGSLTVNAPSILDFGAGASTIQFTTGVTSNAALTVNNWVNMVDYFYSSTNAGTQGQAPLNNIVFNGFVGNDTTWLPYDSGPGPDNQITPVPEPEVYGAAFVSGLLALVAWRRRRRSSSSHSNP